MVQAVPITIDLDARAAAPPGPVPVGRLARAAACLASIALVATLTAAGGWRPVFVEEFALTVSTAADVVVGANTVFLAAVRDGYVDLTAFAGGERRWHAEARTDGLQFARIRYTPGTVVLSVYGGAGRTADAIAYDPTTGERLWDYPAGFFAWLPDGLVLLSRPRSTPAAEGGRVAVEHAVVNRATGSPVWIASLPEAQEDAWALDWGGQPDAPVHRLGAVSASGVLTVRDLRTGQLVASRSTPPVPGPRSVAVAHGLLLVIDNDLGSASITAYDATTLAYRWTQGTVPLERGVDACGPMLCATSASGVTALDPASGRPLWQRRDRQILGEVGPGYLITAASRRDIDIASPATGRSIMDLRGWLPHLQPTGTVLLTTRIDPVVPGRTSFGLLRLDAGTVEPVGSVDGDFRDCFLVEISSRAGRILCLSDTGDTRTVTSWRWRHEAGRRAPGG